MANTKKKVAVLFGGKSPEHEISIITGIQVMNAINKNRFEVLPVYVTKIGEWILGDVSFLDIKTFKDLENISSKGRFVLMPADPNIGGLIQQPKGLTILKPFLLKKIDVVFPTFHGKYGEDGSIQGLLELSDIPYVGCDVQSSAIGMDKIISKRIAKSIGIPVLDDVWVLSTDWKASKSIVLKRIRKNVNFPIFVKPVHLGSSIGVTKVHNISELENALDVAFFYDTKVIVEESLENAKEVNISILGNNPYEVSVCEMPISSGETLSFDDKYTSKNGTSKGMASAKRIIPAPIKQKTQEEIEEYARIFFAEIGGQGIARIDFLVSGDESKIFLNEINTMPGSVAFYLWEKVGISFDILVEKLISLGIARSEEKKKLTTTFRNNVLSRFSNLNGAKT